ncbi:MAG: 1-deoxy-D-xylulose-5-phosphate synthase [Candidatus Omnitrophica bacterium]|nr:1-deoxy-D-xylulose-5-phosphate synthase [Candidatus Omnitrophota bacterium]
MSLLEKIDSPQDLKGLNIKELPVLADEIRQEIIKVVSKNGGHLASNLGVVELSICLHYLLNCPDDTIVWDVGHQIYTHKLLTGRKKDFKNLRRLNGLSGFPNFRESSYDPFIVGHSGTAISQALGMVMGQTLQESKTKVVAVIGDASLSTGMVFEAMNNCGCLQKNLTVILNDNEMAISKSTGVLSNYLNRVISSSIYNRIKNNLSSLIKAIPMIGTKVLRLAERLEESLKNLLIPGMFFEQLGFKYFGPLDGHNIHGLLDTLKNVFSIQKPTLVHIITKKGKGYSPAEQFPEKFHSASPFNITTGKFTPKIFLTYTDIFAKTLLELARQDESIVAITAAMELGTGLNKFRDEFPQRFFDVGIAEQHAVTFASGLCKQGMKPFVAIYSTFLQRAYDQIMHDVCLQNLPVVFIVSNASIVGEDGATHQGIFDFAYLGSMPNLAVLAPKDAEEFRNMIKFAVKQKKQPIAIRYPKSPVTSHQSTENRKPRTENREPKTEEIELGKSEILREGKDAMIIAIGSMVYPCLQAGDILSKRGIDCGLINSRFLKPLDESLLLKLSLQTNRFITVEEHSLEGGLGSKILEFFADRDIKTKVKRIGLPCRFIEHGKREELLSRYGLTAEKIAEKIEKWMKR